MIDAAGGAGDGPIDLVVDPASFVHVAYRGRRDGDQTLVYARRALDRTWTTTSVERLGNDPSLVVDPDGIVHIAYLYTSGWQLHYARRESDGEWMVSMLDVVNPQRWPALSIDGSGRLHLMYVGEGGLFYAPAFNTTWAPIAVDLPRWTGRISLVAAEGVHLTFHARTEAGRPTVAHAYLAPGAPDRAWSTSMLDLEDVDGVFLPGGIALDPDGGAHMIYARVEAGVGSRDLRYGYRPAGGAWTTELLQEDTQQNARSLTVDAMGGVHVALFGGEGAQYGHMRRCAE